MVGQPLECQEKALRWAGLREGVELVEDIGGALALEHLPLGFLYLDDGKTRVSNDPLLSYAAPRTMLGAVVALDDAWQHDGSLEKDHIGQMSLVRELCS